MDAEQVQHWYARWQHALYVLFLLAAAPLPYFAQRLETDNAIEHWLDESAPVVAEYQAFCDRFGTNDFVVLGFDDCPPDDRRLELLARSVEKLPAVGWCWTPQRAAELEGVLTGEPPDELRAIRVPLVSRHPHFAATLIALRADAALDRSNLLRQLQQLVEGAGFSLRNVHWGGPPVINVGLDRLANDSLTIIFPLACGLMLLLLAHLLKRISLALMVLLCSGVSVLSTLAVMAVAGATMNMLLVALPPMILVLNLSFGVHLVHRWQRAASQPHPVGTAVVQTIKPAALAAGTTAIGTASLVFSHFVPVRSFGVWAATGTLLALVLTYLYIPAMLVAERPPPHRVSSGLAPLAQPRGWVVLGLWLAVLLAAGGGLWRLRAQSDALRFFPENCKVLADYRRLEQRLTGLLAVEADVQLPAHWSWTRRVETVRAIERALEKHPAVESVIALPDWLRADPQRAGEQVVALMEDADYGPLVRTMLSQDGRHWRITASIASAESDNLSTIVRQLRQAVPADVRVNFTGLVPLIMAAQQEIFRSLLVSFLAALVLLAGGLALALRSLDASLVAMLPNVTPIAIVFGVYGWLERPLTVGTLMTASTALGIALDDTLHLLAEFRRQSRSHPTQSNFTLAQASIRECGLPMLQTTIIAALGLGLLAFSRFVPAAQFGGLLALLLLAALACDLWVLPAILATPLGRLFRAPPGASAAAHLAINVSFGLEGELPATARRAS